MKKRLKRFLSGIILAVLLVGVYSTLSYAATEEFSGNQQSGSIALPTSSYGTYREDQRSITKYNQKSYGLVRLTYGYDMGRTFMFRGHDTTTAAEVYTESVRFGDSDSGKIKQVPVSTQYPYKHTYYPQIQLAYYATYQVSVEYTYEP